MTVLLVALETAVRSRLVEAISELQGIRVLVHDPRNKGLEGRIRRIRPEVVLIDIQVPSGLRLLHQLHAAHFQQVPVLIALASTSADSYRTRCQEAGAAHYFDSARELDRLLQSLASMQSELK